MRGRKLDPQPLSAGVGVDALVDEFFLSYNAARLREACHIFADKMLEPDVTVGLTISGALTPTGLGYAAFVPLVEAGFVDWIVSTGANIYHDMHRSLGLSLYGISPQRGRRGAAQGAHHPHLRHRLRPGRALQDRRVRRGGAEVRRVPEADEHGGAALDGWADTSGSGRKLLGTTYRSLIGAAWECGVPIYTSSPGDSSLGMGLAALRLQGYEVGFDPELDVNETAAIVYDAKRSGGKSGVLILGGGSPKNFALQTEPQIQEIYGLAEKGHDYFIQITDARADTGGLSGATSQEAVTWGKVDPEQLPDTVVCYTDSTIALPIMTAYALTRRKPRARKRLFDRRAEMLSRLASDFKRS